MTTDKNMKYINKTKENIPYIVTYKGDVNHCKLGTDNYFNKVEPIITTGHAILAFEKNFLFILTIGNFNKLTIEQDNETTIENS